MRGWYTQPLGVPKAEEMFSDISLGLWVIEISNLHECNARMSEIVGSIIFSEIFKNLGAGFRKLKMKVFQHFSTPMGHINF